jgi:hypothetical protein
VLAISRHIGIIADQLDVETALLNSDVDKEIYAKTIPGFREKIRSVFEDTF